MCCFLVILVTLGPRIGGALWWLFQPVRWEAAFRNFLDGGVWWLWPILGIIFLPWTTIMYVIVAPGGVIGFDWVWIVIGVLIDVSMYTGGFGRRFATA